MTKQAEKTLHTLLKNLSEDGVQFYQIDKDFLIIPKQNPFFKLLIKEYFEESGYYRFAKKFKHILNLKNNTEDLASFDKMLLKQKEEDKMTFEVLEPNIVFKNLEPFNIMQKCDQIKCLSEEIIIDDKSFIVDSNIDKPINIFTPAFIRTITNAKTFIESISMKSEDSILTVQFHITFNVGKNEYIDYVLEFKNYDVYMEL